MHQVTIHEAKTHLSKLIREALAGEEVIISRNRTPLVKLTVLSEIRPQRKIGGGKGLLLDMDESFNEPLDDFEGYM